MLAWYTSGRLISAEQFDWLGTDSNMSNCSQSPAPSLQHVSQVQRMASRKVYQPIITLKAEWVWYD